MEFKNIQQHVINGKGDKDLEQTRPFGLYRPCDCGCDHRDGAMGVGYLHGIKDGTGVTIWIDTEEVYEALKLFVPEMAVRREYAEAKPTKKTRKGGGDRGTRARKLILG